MCLCLLYDFPRFDYVSCFCLNKDQRQKHNIVVDVRDFFNADGLCYRDSYHECEFTSLNYENYLKTKVFIPFEKV